MSVYAFVEHTIKEHPDTDVTYEAECLWCDWAATPADDSEPVDMACMQHTGRTGHAGFRRLRTSFAMVIRRK
ncbi:DUF7848 domain-containing protein [Streptomyces sp. KR80]|uniref:DUF7848 domain-containing protein n=1 Tax=Streptomyces sp. KR80 TaxID=3457426 RepID=UPI003FD53782